MSASISSILAVHPGALGDVVLLGHLLRALGGRAKLVAGGEKGRLLQGLGVVDRALDFDSLPMHEAFSEEPVQRCRLPAILAGRRRLVSCFAAGNETAQRRLALLAGAQRADYVPIRPPAGFAGHLLECWSGRLGVALPADAAPWPVPQAWREEASECLRAIGVDPAAPYWVVHAGAGAREKCWPLRRFMELAGTLAGSPGRPVFALGPVERERWAGAVQDLARAHALVLCPPLATLAGVLAGARAYVGNDSGASHLAAAVGAPTVAIFREPTQIHFAPRGRHVAIVSGPAMEDITVARVAERMEGLLR